MWRDQMQRGSFRGAPFGVKSQGTDGGRRVAMHEYPARDEPWPEDLGRKGRVHNLDLHVIGPDYMSARDALLSAVEAKGPGELVHPWLGRLQVQIDTYRLRESIREGGMATFQITCTEGGKQQFPSSAIDTAAVVDTQASQSSRSAQAEFASVFAVAGQPGWVAAEAISVLQQVTSEIDRLAQSVPSSPTAMSPFMADIGDLSGRLPALVQTPAVLAGRIASAITSMSGLFTAPLTTLDVYRELSLFGGNMSTPPANTPARLAQRNNQQAVVSLVAQHSVIDRARSSAVAIPESSAAAIALRDDLADHLDTHAFAATDAMYRDLTDLRAAVVSDLTDRAAMLPQITSYTPARTLPALLIAHRTYGDAARADEIIARNHINRPLFVPGGSALELLQ